MLDMSRRIPTTRSQGRAPLKPAVFHILLALAKRERHGLGIAGEVEASTGGAMRLGPGTLYRSLKQMMRDGLIDEVSSRQEDEDPRRKFYRITATGRMLVRAEARRYENLVDLARQRNVLPQTR